MLIINMRNNPQNNQRYMLMKINASTALLTAAVFPCTAVYAADNTKIGYGQGTAVDEKKRPVDAMQFNSRFGDLDAFALSGDDKRIIITFDQGYENGYTARILDTLREKNVQAIFFLTGPYARTESALVKRMINEGHILGNHGMTHASLPTLCEEDAKKEIMSLHDYVMNNYGYQMQYFRCPCGEYSEQTLETVKNCGYKTLFWSSAYVDWDINCQPAPAESLQKLTDAAHGGEILLLHSVSATNTEILGQLIDNFRAKGFKV